MHGNRLLGKLMNLTDPVMKFNNSIKHTMSKWNYNSVQIVFVATCCGPRYNLDFKNTYQTNEHNTCLCGIHQDEILVRKNTQTESQIGNDQISLKK